MGLGTYMKARNGLTTLFNPEMSLTKIAVFSVKNFKRVTFPADSQCSISNGDEELMLVVYNGDPRLYIPCLIFQSGLEELKLW